MIERGAYVHPERANLYEKIYNHLLTHKKWIKVGDFEPNSSYNPMKNACRLIAEAILASPFPGPFFNRIKYKEIPIKKEVDDREKAISQVVRSLYSQKPLSDDERRIAHFSAGFIEFNQPVNYLSLHYSAKGADFETWLIEKTLKKILGKLKLSNLPDKTLNKIRDLFRNDREMREAIYVLHVGPCPQPSEYRVANTIAHTYRYGTIGDPFAFTLILYDELGRDLRSYLEFERNLVQGPLAKERFRRCELLGQLKDLEVFKEVIELFNIHEPEAICQTLELFIVEKVDSFDKEKVKECAEYFRQLGGHDPSPIQLALFLKALHLYAKQSHFEDENEVRIHAQKFGLTLNLHDWMQIYVNRPNGTPKGTFCERLKEFDLTAVELILLSLLENKTHWDKTLHYLSLLRDFSAFLPPGLVYSALLSPCLNENVSLIVKALQDKREGVLARRHLFDLPSEYENEIRLLTSRLVTEFPELETPMSLLRLFFDNDIASPTSQHWSDCFPRHPEMKFEVREAQSLQRLSACYAYSHTHRGIFKEWVGNVFQITLIQSVFCPQARTLQARLEVPPETYPFFYKLTQKLLSPLPQAEIEDSFEAQLKAHDAMEMWESFECPHKQEVGQAYFRFVSYFQRGFRSAWAEISANIASPAYGSEAEMAALGNIYAHKDGLSLLPLNHPYVKDSRFFLSERKYHSSFLACAQILERKETQTFHITLDEGLVRIEIKGRWVAMFYKASTLSLNYGEETSFGPPFEGPLKVQLLLLMAKIWRDQVALERHMKSQASDGDSQLSGSPS